MIHRNQIVQFSDIACEDYTRLADEEIRELQDQFNVNNCDECDSWLDAEDESYVTIIEESEFWERYADIWSNIAGWLY